MKELRITFTKCEQISQAIDDENEHMKAKVYFTISKRDGSDGEDLNCIVRQPDGGKRVYEEDSIEVENPDELRRKINYGEFRDVVEKYYRLAIGKDGKAISFDANASIEMIGNNTSIDRKIFFINAAMQSGAW